MIYVVIENGEVYPLAYKRYMQALQAVKKKHKEYIEAQIKEIGSLEQIEYILSNINVLENTEKGKTHLYIEKGIHIVIIKLEIQPAEF